MRLIFRSGGEDEEAACDARYQRYMSFAPRFLVFVIAERKALTVVGSEGNAARSSVRSAGVDDMLPRRDTRRPFWSWFNRRSNWNWGMRASAANLLSAVIRPCGSDNVLQEMSQSRRLAANTGIWRWQKG